MIERYYDGDILHADERIEDPITPGCRVKHKSDVRSRGIVVAIEIEGIKVISPNNDAYAEQHTIVVLWSREPENVGKWAVWVRPTC